MIHLVRYFLLSNLLIALTVLLTPSTLLAQGRWEVRSSDGFRARHSFSANAIGKLIYVIGGRDTSGGAGSELEVYDVDINRWSSPTVSGPEFKRASHRTALVGSQIYCFGGLDEHGDLDSSVWLFDVPSRSWSKLATSGQWSPRFDFASQIVENKIYVIGGIANFSAPTGMDVFDITTRQWSQPTTTGAYVNASANTSAVVDGKIYVMGGFTEAGNELDLRKFDPETNEWTIVTTKGGLMGPARYPTCEVLNGKIYMMAGASTPDNLVKEVKIFDPATLRVRVAISAGSYTGRIDPRSVTVGETFYLIGGYDPDIIKISTLDLFFATVSDVESEDASAQISIWPNPFQSNVVISGIPENTLSVGVYDMLGRHVLEIHNPQGGRCSMDLHHLAPSTYVVKVSTPTSAYTEVIVRN